MNSLQTFFSLQLPNHGYICDAAHQNGELVGEVNFEFFIR